MSTIFSFLLFSLFLSIYQFLQELWSALVFCKSSLVGNSRHFAGRSENCHLYEGQIPDTADVHSQMALRVNYMYAVPDSLLLPQAIVE